MSTVWDEKPSSSSSALVSMPSTQKSTFNVVLKNMFGRLSPEERAALALQCAFRKHMAVRELAYLQRRERLILVMIAIEDEQAVRVQRAWREKVKKRADQVEMRAVLKLQSQLRGNMSRRIHLPEQKALAHRIRRAARCIQRYARVAIAKAYMKEQCRGIIEKQGRALNLFWRMEMVVWQERYVFLTDQALHYQKLTKQRLADTATTKAVRFCDVNKVTAQYEDCVLVLHCRQRSYKFLLPSPADCETWANNVLQLVNLAGARARPPARAARAARATAARGHDTLPQASTARGRSSTRMRERTQRVDPPPPLCAQGTPRSTATSSLAWRKSSRLSVSCLLIVASRARDDSATALARSLAPSSHPPAAARRTPRKEDSGLHLGVALLERVEEGLALVEVVPRVRHALEELARLELARRADGRRRDLGRRRGLAAAAAHQRVGEHVARHRARHRRGHRAHQPRALRLRRRRLIAAAAAAAAASARPGAAPAAPAAPSTTSGAPAGRRRHGSCGRNPSLSASARVQG